MQFSPLCENWEERGVARCLPESAGVNNLNMCKACVSQNMTCSLFDLRSTQLCNFDILHNLKLHPNTQLYKINVASPYFFPNSFEEIIKGQIISKGLLVSSNSPKKRTNEFIITTKTNQSVRYLGEFEDTKKSFRNYLTFTG